MKIWLFGTYAWQGNPKALFLYMMQNCAQTHECWWVADNEDAVKDIKKTTGFENIIAVNSAKAKELFAKADVYVTENFRESYPTELSDSTKIFNTWHGVGLKHIELALGMQSVLVDSVVKKYIKNFSKYKNQVLFLATSQSMEEHFIEDTAIQKNHIIRGRYPRNEVYREIQTYQINEILPKPIEEYKSTILFAPTYRIGTVNGVLQFLLPNFEQLEQICIENNQLFIVKVHPFMKKDNFFIEMEEKYRNNAHIIFWNDIYDIYEIFNKIDIAIVDYSSIFYDMLDAGVEKFIRYIPDFESYQQDLELIGDYLDLTDGVIINQFQDLLAILKNNNIQKIEEERKKYLMNYFFGYEIDSGSLKDMVEEIDNFRLQSETLRELHSFDIFDTLIRRSTLKPFSIFDYVRDEAKRSSIQFPVSLIENWVTIRNKVEHDVRDMMRKTTFERKSNKIEISLNDIYIRLQKNLNLTDEQIQFLQQTEEKAEIAHVEAITKRIEYLFSLKEAGHDVILISDMYLPETTIRAMLTKADERLADIPLFLSSSIGYQKSTGKLYQHIFFELKYNYSRWVHYGDNKHADGVVPRRLGIETAVHHIDDFIPYENAMISAMDNYNRYPAYQLATKMHRYRTELVKQMDNKVLEENYYAYAYAGSALVPYINWVIRDAIQRGYETLYFISRDGHFLKQIADKIIAIRGHNIQTKYIYGSRKAWRLPSFIDKVDEETFWQFGNFVGMDSFDDLVSASYLNEDELLELFPEFVNLKNAKHLRGEVAENIRKILGASTVYHQKILELAAEKRILIRQYLQQEINPQEKFAFVEFWGRGYTQDTFGRLLNDAFGQEIQNPFYYVRSFTDDIGTSIRHNFILAPQNFSFFEPVFAQTPYDSISGYELKDGKVEPIIYYRDATISDWILEGLLKFVEDYLSLTTLDEDYFNISLAQFTYQYQLTTYTDQFLNNVFGELKDNISSFGEAKSYAPALTVTQLNNIASKQELDKLTLSIPMSLAKSDKKVVEYYNKIQKAYKLPAYSIEPTQKVYAVNPLENYVYSETFPFRVIALKRNAIYNDMGFNDTTKRTDKFLNYSDEIDILAIDWLRNGVPRLLTQYGYITAHKEYVKISPNSIKKPEEVSEYREANNKKNKNSIIFQNKKYKFLRDPYLFFKDSKNTKVKKLKVLFDEKHALGRALSRFVRNKFN